MEGVFSKGVGGEKRDKAAVCAHALAECFTTFKSSKRQYYGSRQARRAFTNVPPRLFSVSLEPQERVKSTTTLE